MYAIRNNEILEVEIIGNTKKGTPICQQKNLNNKIKISASKLFNFKECAEEEISNKKIIKQKQEIKLRQESEEIEKIVFQIMDEFNVIIRYLDRPSTIEDAWNLYYSTKKCK